MLKYFQRFQDINQAIEFEKQIKGWSRKKKEALFKEDWEALNALAKSHSKPSSTRLCEAATAEQGKLRLTTQLPNGQELFS